MQDLLRTMDQTLLDRREDFHLLNSEMLYSLAMGHALAKMPQEELLYALEPHILAKADTFYPGKLSMLLVYFFTMEQGSIDFL